MTTPTGELIEQTLRQGNAVSFRARGASMHPFIHSGDVMTVLPARPHELRRGHIAFYRNPAGRLRAHRVVALHRHGGRPVFITRGDAQALQTERIDAACILGRVVRIRRGARTLRVGAGPRHWLGLLWARSQPYASALHRRLRRTA